MLGHDTLISYLKSARRLVDGLIDEKIQVQPNGIELTLNRIEVCDGEGAIDFDNSERVLPARKVIPFDNCGWVSLKKGGYNIIFNEQVNFPKDLAGISIQRSTFLRCGASVEIGIWDAGYSGRGEGFLVVHNEAGIRIKKNARMVQMLFFRLDKEVKEGYSGRYQNERK